MCPKIVRRLPLPQKNIVHPPGEPDMDFTMYHHYMNCKSEV
jgi:hypothetical protein